MYLYMNTCIYIDFSIIMYMDYGFMCFLSVSIESCDNRGSWFYHMHKRSSLNPLDFTSIMLCWMSQPQKESIYHDSRLYQS
jgi:hypothetical protein